MPIGIMNDEVEKRPLSEGHNTALNRKAFRKATGRGWGGAVCWGLSDTRLIRGSSSEVLVCTMKHADGDTMTHMLRLTASDLDVALKEEEEKHTHTHTWREFQDAPRGPFSQSLRVHVRTYWFDLRENALSLLIAGP